MHIPNTLTLSVDFTYLLRPDGVLVCHLTNVILQAITIREEKEEEEVKEVKGEKEEENKQIKVVSEQQLQASLQL